MMLCSKLSCDAGKVVVHDVIERVVIVSLRRKERKVLLAKVPHNNRVLYLLSQNT